MNFVYAYNASTLVVYYKFDNATTSGNTSIDSKNFANSTLRNNVLSGQPAYLNQGYFFDGVNDDLLVNATSYQIFSPPNISVCVMVNVSNNTVYQVIASKAGSLSTNKDWLLDMSGITPGSGRPTWYVFVGITGHYVESNISLNNNEFSLVCGSWNGTARSIWVNGVLAGRTQGVLSKSVTSQQVMIGSRLAGSYFKGVLDEFFILNVSLNDSSASSLWNNCFNGSVRGYDCVAQIANGSISISSITPAQNTNVSANNTMNFSTSVCCTGGICNNVAVSLRVKDSNTIQNSIVTYHKFDNATSRPASSFSMSVDSTNFTNGSILEPISLGVPGYLNEAYYFNTSSVNLGNMPTLSPSRITVCAVINSTAINSYNVIASKAGTSGNTKEWLMDINGLNASSGKPVWYVFQGETGYGVESNISLNNNQFYFVCGSWNGTTRSIWIDGVLAGRTQQTLSVSSTSTHALIGKRLNSDYFKGVIDEFFILNKSIDDAETMFFANTCFNQSSARKGYECIVYDSGANDSIVTYHKFDNVTTLHTAGTNTSVDSANNTNGTVSSAAVGNVGYLNEAYSLSSNGVDLGNSLSLVPPNMTVCAMVNSTDITTYGVIASKAGADDGTKDWLLDMSGITPTSGKPVWYVFQGITGYYVESNISLSNNQFALVCGAWNGTTRSIWVNGVLAGRVEQTLTPSPSSTNVYVGHRLFSNYFQGIIDEFFILRKSITDTEAAIMWSACFNQSSTQKGYDCLLYNSTLNNASSIIISNQSDATPFFVNMSNPSFVNLSSSCTTISWRVNATGSIGSTHGFSCTASFVNQTSTSQEINITIV